MSITMAKLGFMADKGELMREKEGKQYTYWIASQNESSSKNILKRIQDKIFAGKPAAMVSYLLDADSEISDKDLEEIEKLIQKRRTEKKRG